MAKLVLFVNISTGAEYVVIVTDGDVSGYEKPGYEIGEIIDLPENQIYKFPTDRVLVAED